MALFCLGASPARCSSPPNVKLWEWEKGFAVESLSEPDMAVYLWFYEWNMFDARTKGEHTSGTYKLKRLIGADQRTAKIEAPDMTLSLRVVQDGAELLLSITNRTDYSWPAIAGIIPCFNPGAPKSQASRFPLAKLNRQFDNQKTWFVGSNGLQRLQRREIHFNARLHGLVDRATTDGRYAFSHKWPTSNDNADAGILIRESTDGRWVTGIAWQDYLSAQGHNPWQCMHLCIAVGPLQPGQSKTIRGMIYLMKGTKEACLARYRKDLPVPSAKR